MPSLTNYDGSITTTPQQIARPTNVAELQAILKHSDKYPSPVRAMGSNHSLTPCAATPGTVIDMRGMKKVLKIDRQAMTMTAEAGIADDRGEQGPARAAAAADAQHRDRQSHARVRGLLSHEGQPRRRRVRAGELVHHVDQVGHAVGRPRGSLGDEESATAAAHQIELRPGGCGVRGHDPHQAARDRPVQLRHPADRRAHAADHGRQDRQQPVPRLLDRRPDDGDSDAEFRDDPRERLARGIAAVRVEFSRRVSRARRGAGHARRCGPRRWGGRRVGLLSAHPGARRLHAARLRTR